MRRRFSVAFGAAIAVGVAAPVWAGGITERVSVGANGRQVDGSSDGPALSAIGRFVGFTSNAANLVPGDTNGAADVFVHDRTSRETERVSVGPNGRQGDNISFVRMISAGGRFVAFESDASNLIPGDTNRATDVFVHDRRTRQTVRVSVGRGGDQADGGSSLGDVSFDGRFVVFYSGAANLVPADTNGTGDVFVRDRGAGTTERVSIGPGGRQGDGENFFGAFRPMADSSLSHRSPPTWCPAAPT
jgi:cold shock CspA family protein